MLKFKVTAKQRYDEQPEFAVWLSVRPGVSEIHHVSAEEWERLKVGQFYYLSPVGEG